MRRWVPLITAAVAALAVDAAVAQDRGQLLYGNHCIACHSTQMHWRDKKLATDWSSLKEQVRRWQGTAQLNWSEADIDDVARFLNDSFYRFPGGAKVAVAPLR
jgi:mono/diheme cytochrome c family protein